jgi:hypothetical protein
MVHQHVLERTVSRKTFRIRQSCQPLVQEEALDLVEVGMHRRCRGRMNLQERMCWMTGGDHIEEASGRG